MTTPDPAEVRASVIALLTLAMEIDDEGKVPADMASATTGALDGKDAAYYADMVALMADLFRRLALEAGPDADVR